MALSFRKFISEVFVNGKFPKILPSENFPLYGNTFYVMYISAINSTFRGKWYEQHNYTILKLQIGNSQMCGSF